TYPAKAYQEEIEADVYADVELDAQGRVQKVEITALTHFWYDEEGALVEQSANIEEDAWGFAAEAKRNLLRTTWWPAIVVDDANPKGQARPVIVERMVSFLWEEAVLADSDDTPDAPDADMPLLEEDL